MTDYHGARERIGGDFMVTRVYIGHNGTPQMDLINGHGQAEVGVPVPVLGGGAERYVYVPPVADATDARAAAKIIGLNGSSILPTVARPSPSMGAHVDTQFSAPSADEDYPEMHALEDLVVANGSSKIIISKDGSIVIQSPQQSPVRIQLPDNGQLRISHATTTTGERLLLGNKTLTVLQQHADAINDVAVNLADLTSKLNVMFTAANATLAGGINPATMALYIGVLAGQTSLGVFSGTPFDAVDSPGDELLSATVDLSTLSVADAAGADTNESAPG
mgnify:FL=1